MTVTRNSFEEEVRSSVTRSDERVPRAVTYRKILSTLRNDKQPNLALQPPELEYRRNQDTDRRLNTFLAVVMDLIQDLERTQILSESFNRVTSETTEETSAEIDVCQGARTLEEQLFCLRGSANNFIRRQREFDGYWQMLWTSFHAYPRDYRRLSAQLRYKLLNEVRRLDDRITSIDGGPPFVFSTEIFLAARQGTLMVRDDSDKYISSDDPAALNEIPVNNKKITEVVDPTSNQHASTKKYVDDEIISHQGGVDPHLVYAKIAPGITNRNTFGKKSWFQDLKPSTGFGEGDTWHRTIDHVLFIYDGTRWLSTWKAAFRAGRAGTPAGNQHMIQSGDLIANAGTKSHRFDFDIRVVKMRIKSTTPFPSSDTLIRINHSGTFDLNWAGGVANAVTAPNFDIAAGQDFDLQHIKGTTAATDYWAEFTYREKVTA
jgi:hypothetical protein